MRRGFFGPVVDSLGLWWILWACGGFFGPVVDSLGLWWILWACGRFFGPVVDSHVVMALFSI